MIASPKYPDASPPHTLASDMSYFRDLVLLNEIGLTDEQKLRFDNVLKSAKTPETIDQFSLIMLEALAVIDNAHTTVLAPRMYRLPVTVFIGSCTNSRIEDIRAAAKVVAGRKVSETIKLAMIVPGSGLVKAQAEEEGLDRIFTDAGFEWRDPGCSMCLAMNADRLEDGERCASTSNRNFEGRQGRGGRTHLVSPAMAAAAAIAGHFIDPGKLEN